MLGVGWTEMLVIGIVALVVIGPKELPAVMHRIGKFAATIRRMGSDFQRELNKTTGLNEIANLRNSVTAPLKATADAIRKEFNTTTATGEVKPSGAITPADPKVESVVDEIKAAAGMAPAAMAPLTGPANPIAPAVSAKPAESVKPAKSVKPAVSAESPAPPETKPARVRAARAPKVSAPAADTPVAVADIPPAKTPRARKPIESPAPVEAIAPKPRARKAAAPAAVVEATPKAVAKKPVAKKPIAKKPAAAKTPAADKKP
jgi:sec-independent protein translocase protein TatB